MPDDKSLVNFVPRVTDSVTFEPGPLADNAIADVLAIHVAPDMNDLVDADPAARLGQLVHELRDRLAHSVGLVLSPVRVMVDPGVPSGRYRIVLDGAVVSEAAAPRDHVMLVDLTADAATDGVDGVEPVFGTAVRWVHVDEVDDADSGTIRRPEAIVAHLHDIVRRHAAELLTRDAVADLLSLLRERHPAACEEIDYGLLPPAVLHAVLRDLLADGRSIRPLRRIVEELGRELVTGATYEDLVVAARRGADFGASRPGR